MVLFGDFRVRIDPWEVDYGDQTRLASLDDHSDEQVDHEVEVADGQWSAITPSDSTAIPKRVLFVDGVRRLEASLHARQGEQLIYGGFGTSPSSATSSPSRSSRPNIRATRPSRSGPGSRSRAGSGRYRGRWSPRWPVLPDAVPSLRVAARRSRLLSGTLRPSPDGLQWPPRSVAAATQVSPMQQLVLSFLCSRHCSCRRKLLRRCQCPWRLYRWLVLGDRRGQKRQKADNKNLQTRS